MLLLMTNRKSQGKVK